MKKDNLTFSSSRYWEGRYQSGGNSGAGSYGRLAEFKANVLNSFFAANGVESVLEFGCGDGNQLGLMKLKRYVGIDVSQTVIEKCRTLYSDRSEYEFYSTIDNKIIEKCDAVISLDVVFHLIEDKVFAKYIKDLFANSNRYVVIYSSDFDGLWPDKHVSHRNVSSYVEKNIKGWKLRCVVKNAYPYDSGDVNNTSFCDFLIYSKIGETCIVTCPT